MVGFDVHGVWEGEFSSKHGWASPPDDGPVARSQPKPRRSSHTVSYDPSELLPEPPPTTRFTLTARAGWFGRFGGVIQDNPEASDAHAPIRPHTHTPTLPHAPTAPACSESAPG